METVLQSLSATTNPQLAAIIANVDNAPTTAAASAVLQSIQPTVDESAVTSSLNFSDDAFSLTETRLSSLREGNDETGMAAGNLSHGLGAWGQVFGQHVNQNARDNIAGYDANTYGGAAGVDTQNMGARRAVISGKPDYRHVSTSMVERQNLTMRMSMRRFTRLTNGFSKKVENHEHMVAVHYMYYNFGRIHQSLRVTPAMEAGIADHVWSLEEIVGLLD